MTTTKIKNSDSSTPNIPDETLDQKIDKISEFIEKNSMMFIFGFVGLLIGCAAYFSFSLYSKKMAFKKFDSAYKIEQKIDKFTIAETDTSNDVQTKKTPETDSIAFNDVDSEVKAFLNANPSHGASRNLALKWASYLFSVDKFKEANETLLSLNLKKSNSLDGLASLSKASSSVQTGDMEKAITLYKSILATSNWKFLHPEARFQMSLALIETDKVQEAIENLKTIQREHPDERKTVEESKKIIRWLTFKKNRDQ